jgi:hypothetical protein
VEEFDKTRRKEQKKENRKNKSQKHAEFLILGTKIALFNGWEKDAYVTSLNQNPGQMREVFSRGSGKKKLYLSIDFEKMTFELFKYARGEYAKFLREISSITGEEEHDESKSQHTKKTHVLKIKQS